MMLERNAKLAEAEHSIIDESKTISEFYESHKKLYQKVMAGEISIYHSLYQNDKVDQLNKHAEHILKLDILLQGLQLGSLVIMMAILHQTNQSLLSQPIYVAIKSSSIIDFLSKQNAVANDIHLNEVPAEIVEVLEKHGTKCSVNGLSIMRGSCNGSMALRFASLIGIDALLQMADKFPNYQDVRLNEIFDWVGPSLARKPVLLQFGAFKAPTIQPEFLTSHLSMRYNT
jgi:hypothetical protein